jgi:crossover junction endodeoxyribonuclease RuvC
LRPEKLLQEHGVKLTKNITVLGIDPGSRISGFGIVKTEAGKLSCIDCGVWRLNEKNPMPQRLVSFADHLEQLLQMHHIDVMAIEGIFTAKNIQSVLKLGQIRGVALMLGAKAGLVIAEYSPATVKQSVIGYGRASKEQVQYIVHKLLKMRTMPSPSDIADALAIAICHINMTRIESRNRAIQ